MLNEEQEWQMELTSKKSPVPPVEYTVEQSTKVKELKPEVRRKKNRKIHKELHANIVKQMEFYLGDANLSKDRYLTKLISEDPWVDLSIFIEFDKIKVLTTDVSRIAKALKKSTMLDVSEDGTKVRRTTQIQKKDNSEDCTVYVQRLPPDADHDWISKLLSQYGPVNYISIPRYKNKTIKGFACVEYKTSEGARKCIKAFGAKGCELPSQTSPSSLLSITAYEDCDERIAKKPFLKKRMKEEKVEMGDCKESDSKKNSNLQVPQTRKKMKRISINETESTNEGIEDWKRSKKKRNGSDTENDCSNSVSNPPKVEKKHKRSRKRGERNSESLNASDGNYELSDSSAFECDKKRIQIKNESSELDSTKQLVRKMVSLPQEEIYNIPKKRKINDFKSQAANDEGKSYKNVNIEEAKEQESNSESMKEAQPSDKIKAQKEKKKCKRNLLAGKEDLDASDTGLEVISKREWKRLRNIYLEMQRRNVEKISPDNEESREKDVEGEKSARFTFTPEMESQYSDPEDLKSDCLTTRGENGVINVNAGHILPTKIGGDLQNVSRQDLSDVLQNAYQDLDKAIMLTEKQEFQMELASKKIPVPPVEDTVEEPTKVKELKPKVCRKKNRKIHKELHANILKQMEFYFGDANLSKDRYLTKLISEDPWVDLSIFIVFDKIKVLTTDVSRIAKALKKSTMLDVSEDGTKVRRTTPIQKKDNSEECTVYVQRLPPDADHDWISKLLSQYGPVNYISIPRYKNKTIKGFAFVEYETSEGARKCIKAFRAKGCELPSRTSPDSLLSIIAYKHCDERTAKEPFLKKEMKEEKVESGHSPVPQSVKKKKKKRIFVDETISANEGSEDSKRIKKQRRGSDPKNDRSNFVSNPPKVEEEHKRGTKRGERNSESLNTSDGNKELNYSFALECDKKRKKMKHESSELELTKKLVYKMKALPEEESCNISKTRKINDSVSEAPSDKDRSSTNVNIEEAKEKESHSESLKESQTSDKVKVHNEKKKRKRNLLSGKENLDAPDTGVEIMAKKECERLRNKYLEMQRRDVEKINADKEESRKKDVKEEKSARFTLSDPENLKSGCLVTGDVNGVLNQDMGNKLPAKKRSDLQGVSKKNLSREVQNAYQGNKSRNNLPHRLVGLMYQLDLSVLCCLRKLRFQHKYPSLSLEFGDSKTDKFNNIVLRYDEKYIYIQTEIVEKCHTENDISYNRLFIKGDRNFSMYNYFNSFVQHLTSKDDMSLNSIEYLIIYTNSGVDLTGEMRLKQGRSKKQYPFKFDSIVQCGILKDFLFTNDNKKKQGFYQFSQDKTTREEILKRLQFSSAVQNVITEKQLSQKFEKEIKDVFLDKLVFAVNQPNRQELNSIIKDEINENGNFQYDYTALQEEVLHGLTDVEKHKKLGKSLSYIPRIMYEFNLLMLFLRDMFLHKHMFSINLEGNNDGVSNDITVNYRDRITYVKAYTSDSKIIYSQLFPSEKAWMNNKISINKHFSLFNEKLEKNIRYFIVYTNADLHLTEENKLKQTPSKDFYPLQFTGIDIQKKKYKILRNCSCINENGLYQFAQEEATREKLLSLLKLPPSLQKEKEEGRLSGENEKEIKEKFLNKLIFAVNQPQTTELNSVIRDRIKSDIESNSVPHNYEELHEIALRWSESHDVGPITQRITKDIFEDIKNNRLSYQKIQNRDISQEIKFARSVAGREGSYAFDEFLHFLIIEEKLQILKREGINPASMSGILCGTGAKVLKAFQDLYNLWFDVNENKTQYLKTLEEQGINLGTMSNILRGAGANAAQAFRKLYDLWFDEDRNKTPYLETLEKEGINLTSMSSMLSGGGASAAKAFKDLYDLLFDEKGYKTKYLKALEENGISFTRVSSILCGAGNNATKAFKNLYNVWFDEEGNKAQCLRILEKEGVSLSNMSSVLSGAAANAAKAFKNLYNLWFDEEGNKKQYLKTLQEEGVNLASMTSILNPSGSKAATAFKELYDLWFDVDGNKSQYLKTLEEKEINLTNVSSILSRSGPNAAKVFKELYNTFFDDKGTRTEYLKTLEEKGINLANLSSILNGSGAKAPTAFTDLYSLWFDGEQNKTQYLKALEEKGISLINMSSILHGTGANAAKAFKELYNLWFDLNGHKTQYLTTLEEKGIKLTNMTSILGGAGTSAAKAFKDLYDLWFDVEGNQTPYLKALEEKEMNLNNVSSILHGAGANAANAFKDLHDLWFDEDGNETLCLKTLEEKGINLTNISSILNGAGGSAAKAFKELCNTFFDEQGNNKLHLKHFIEEQDEEKCFTLRNLSGVLSGSGANAKGAFEKLHGVCFNKKGKRTKLLDDLHNAGFMPINLSSILLGAGLRASSILKKLHSVCFDEKGERTGLLDDFYKVGITSDDLCSILSGAVNSLERFHAFCFIGESKKYLVHLLNETEGFTPRNLSKIFHGAGANICSTLEDFHDVCFDETGNKTKILDDFYKAGFRPSDLSNILSLAGNNAASIFRNFHKLCFYNENYLNHFLAEEELFRPKKLSRIIRGVGINICVVFKKLHDLCFDKMGKKTNYLTNLMENKRREIQNILYEKVRELLQK